MSVHRTAVIISTFPARRALAKQCFPAICLLRGLGILLRSRIQKSNTAVSFSVSEGITPSCRLCLRLSFSESILRCVLLTSNTRDPTNALDKTLGSTRRCLVDGLRRGDNIQSACFGLLGFSVSLCGEPVTVGRLK